MALEAVTEAACAARAPMTGPLRLGVIPTIGPFLLPRLMPELRSSFPGLRLSFREDLTARLVEGLGNGRLDVLLLALPCDCGAAETHSLTRDEFVVALPPGHPLATQERVSVAALATERLLATSRPGDEVVVLEKESGLARHQTGHNSGVVHAGLYYAPGSLKAGSTSVSGRRKRAPSTWSAADRGRPSAHRC